MNKQRLQASFRDPNGFLFFQDGKIYRQVNESYKESYDKLISSGLYESLISKGWLITHKELPQQKFSKLETERSENNLRYKILEPDLISYISYPYEWCFSQLKDAAILTIKIQLEALKFGMILKDASAYNIQFLRGKPIFIDTLSFDVYEEGKPWVAYRQFCQHFLAPLALIVFCDFRLLQLLRANIDGIPLDLASRLLPAKSWFNYSLVAHIHLHAKAQKRFDDLGRTSNIESKLKMNRLRFEGLISSLLSSISQLHWKYTNTEWGRYYTEANHADDYISHKEKVISNFLDKCKVKEFTTLSDFGANTGKFSRLAVAEGYNVLSYDVDQVAVEKNYWEMKQKSEEHILPLMLDLTNPSPALGWANTERFSFIERQQADVVMALAIIHHLSISNNVPLEFSSQLFSNICRVLIIEFVPKSDFKVKQLLATREDVFPHYNQDDFEIAFKNHFNILEAIPVKNSDRTMYLMENI